MNTMERRTKIIKEYRQTGGDGDGDNIVGMQMVLYGVGTGMMVVGMGTKYFTVSSLYYRRLL